MANKHTTVKAKNHSNELTLTQSTTDCPLIPVQQLEQLHHFRPDIVDWVIQQTEKESVHRRGENKRINTFVFVTQLIGQLCALLVSIGGLAAAVYLGSHGAEKAAMIIGGATLVSLVSIFVLGRRKS